MIICLTILTRHNGVYGSNFKRARRLRDLICSINTRIVNRTATVLSNFLPDVQLSGVAVAKRNKFGLRRVSRRTFKRCFLSHRGVTIPPTVLMGTRNRPPTYNGYRRLLDFYRNNDRELLRGRVLTDFRNTTNVLVVDTIQYISSGRVRPFRSSGFPGAPRGADIKVLFPKRFLATLHGNGRFGVEINKSRKDVRGASQRSMDNWSDSCLIRVILFGFALVPSPASTCTGHPSCDYQNEPSCR